MKIIDQYCEWVRKPEGALELIELAGRTYYKSEILHCAVPNMANTITCMDYHGVRTKDVMYNPKLCNISTCPYHSTQKFVKMLKDRGHHNVIEHAVASVCFITNRGVTRELVRHRLASFSQESTRYVRYDGEMEFIKPVWYVLNTCHNDGSSANTIFRTACMQAEKAYQELLRIGWRPEQARGVLPNALKTEIIMTADLREWMHIFNLRCSPKTHPQMRALMLECAGMFAEEIPVLFDQWKREGDHE